jgi:hypothetical protein
MNAGCASGFRAQLQNSPTASGCYHSFKSINPLLRAADSLIGHRRTRRRNALLVQSSVTLAAR